MAQASPLSTSVLSAASLVFAYGSRLAIDGVSLAIDRGTLAGIIGPNGSGKSTLIRLLSGYLRPRSGEVQIGDDLIAHIPRRELARRISVVTQEHSVDFPFSVAEVVLMGRAPHLGGALFESARDIEIARLAMTRTGVATLAHRPLSELSGGERQRVILARALAQEAPLLLLDEPTAFLDIRHQVEVFELLRELCAEGYTVVAAVHDLNLAAGYCDSLSLLRGGRLLAAGTPEAVLTAASVRAAYEIDVEVHNEAGVPRVSPLRRRHG